MRHIKKSVGLRAFEVSNNFVLIIISACMFLPFVIILATSLSSEASIIREGYTIWPREWSLDAYNFVMETNAIGRGYMISIFVTIVGTAISVTITAMAGYALSRNNLKYRNFFSLLFYFTMVFSGGLVPWYIMVARTLGLRDTIWALILPLCFNPFNMLLIRNFFKTLPDSVIESAKLDGAGELRIFLSVILPISLPGMATITLFYMLAFWNDWWLSLLFIDDSTLYPLQFLLRQVLSNIQALTSGLARVVKISAIPKETVQMATSVITIGPIIFVYPFIQRYFIKGLTVGAVKG